MLSAFLAVAAAQGVAGATVISKDGNGSSQLHQSSGTITITATNSGSASAPAPGPPPAASAPAPSASSGSGQVSVVTQVQASLVLGICQGVSLGTSTCQAPPAPAAPVAVAAPVGVSPVGVAEVAESEIRLVGPALQLSPDSVVDPAAKQIVNAPTWAWLPAGAWVPLVATAAAGPVVVTATATPEAITIDYADGGVGHTVSCGGPGTPFSAGLAQQEDPTAPLSAASPDCGWTFRATSTGAPGGKDSIVATVTYDVTWVVQGAAGGGDLGPLVSPATDYAVPVAQIEVLNTN